MDNSGIQDLTAITEAVEEYNSFKGYIRQVQEVNDGNTVNSSDGEALHGIIDTLRIFPNFASEVDKDMQQREPQSLLFQMPLTIRTEATHFV